MNDNLRSVFKIGDRCFQIFYLYASYAHDD